MRMQSMRRSGIAMSKSSHFYLRYFDFDFIVTLPNSRVRSTDVWVQKEKEITKMLVWHIATVQNESSCLVI
jgi:hypothetical protein